MAGQNGYGANAFLGGFMRGYDFVDTLDQRDKQLKDAAEEKQYQRQKDAAGTWSAPVEALDSESGKKAYFSVNNTTGGVRGLAGITPAPDKVKYGIATYEDNGKKLTRLTADGVPIGDPIATSSAKEAAPESWSVSSDLVDSNGNPLMVSNRGATRPLSGARRAAKNGTSLTVGPDGTVQFNDGGSTPLAKPTQGELEKTVVSSQAGLDRLRSIQRSFDPKYLNLQHQLGSEYSQLKDKVGLASDADKQTIANYEGFKSKTLNNLNLYIKDITGAAMSEAEADRIKSSVPNLSDGPTAFKSKLDSVMGELSRAQARAYYVRRNGLSMDNVPLDNMDKIIDDYGANVEAQIKQQNPNMSPAEVDQLAHEQVKRAFGM